MKSFKELIVWQKSMLLVKEIYKITDLLPEKEVYNLSNQMRRSSISIPSNISEGYRRKNRKEYIQFLYIASGSAAELETQLILTKDIYMKINTNKASSLIEEIQKMLASMIRKLSPRALTLNP